MEIFRKYLRNRTKRLNRAKPTHLRKHMFSKSVYEFCLCRTHFDEKIFFSHGSWRAHKFFALLCCIVNFMCNFQRKPKSPLISAKRSSSRSNARRRLKKQQKRRMLQESHPRMCQRRARNQDGRRKNPPKVCSRSGMMKTMCNFAT